MKTVLFILLGSFTFVTAQNNNALKKEITPPEAIKITKELKAHNQVRIDDYYWMNNREDPQVISYLNSEDRKSVV